MTCAALALPARAIGADAPRLSLEEALRAARRAAPELAVARAQESVAHADVGIAGTYPNPSLALGTSTETARFSGTASIPLVILGQRGASVDAARAEEQTVLMDTLVAWNDVRQATVHAYVALWLADGTAEARRDSATIEATLEAAVVDRVQVGAAPEIDSLRVHAERLRADADLMTANARVTAAATELGRWMGLRDAGELRATASLPAPESPPPLGELLGRLDASALVRREQSDVRASAARLARERALVRPNLSVDLGADFFDPTLLPAGAPAGETPPVNYRAQLSIDVPLFNQRGAYIEREKAAGAVARAHVQAARVQSSAALAAAYRGFEAASAQERTFVDSVLPAAQSAATATQEAYSLGRAQLVSVLEAVRALVDTRVAALEARAARVDAWADVEHALGAP